jgi:hypothetical protein
MLVAPSRGSKYTQEKNTCLFKMEHFVKSPRGGVAGVWGRIQYPGKPTSDSL